MSLRVQQRHSPTLTVMVGVGFMQHEPSMFKTPLKAENAQSTALSSSADNVYI